MSVRMKMTSRKTRQRRSHHALQGPRLSKDTETGEPVLRHRASPTTGRYRGRVVVDMAAALAKKEEKRKRREREAARLGEPTREKREEEESRAEPAKPLDAAELSRDK